MDKERDILEALCGKPMVDVLWNDEIVERHIDTEYHEYRVWKEDGVVKAELKRREL